MTVSVVVKIQRFVLRKLGTDVRFVDAFCCGDHYAVDGGFEDGSPGRINPKRPTTMIKSPIRAPKAKALSVLAQAPYSGSSL